jgi:hypothetical protein
MRARIAGAFIVAGLFLVALVPSAAAAGNASCAGQFASATAQAAQPFGQVIVVPEVRDLTLGGPNLGQEVKVFLATADRTACPLA